LHGIISRYNRASGAAGQTAGDQIDIFRLELRGLPIYIHEIVCISSGFHDSGIGMPADSL
jgi:hypothetical protein